MIARGALDSRQTIFGLASGALPSAIAILRISGGSALSIGAALFRLRTDEPLPRQRGLYVGEFRDPSDRCVDEGIALVFPGPASATGEDVVEFQCHGSIAVVRVLERLLIERGARPATKGEFTYRSFLNGKQSAADLETLADVFAVRQPGDLSAIYARREGALAALLARVREALIGLQATLDTAIDFSEEYSGAILQAEKPLRLAIHECSAAIQRFEGFAKASSGVRLVLAGAPNAGKSSLFNALIGRRRALVYPDPGTTRDAIEDEIDLGGRAVRLVDTAGIRSVSGEGPESEGIALSRSYLETESPWVLVVDGTKGLARGDTDLLEAFHSTLVAIAWNKSDQRDWSFPSLPFSVFAVSAATGHGLSDLVTHLAAKLVPVSSEVPLPTAAEASRLNAVLHSLENLLARLGRNALPEELAEESRGVIRLIESVVGEIDTEAILDRVFREFCIGK